MLRTIEVGSCVLVQGPVLRTLGDGRVVIRVAGREHVGLPLRPSAKPLAVEASSDGA